MSENAKVGWIAGSIVTACCIVAYTEPWIKVWLGVQ